MNKSAIKNFAIWARNKLIADISYKAGLLGITEKEIQNPIRLAEGMQGFHIGSSEPYRITGAAIAQRKALANKICGLARQRDYTTAYKSVIEEVAYTWFNRLIAIRFMEANDYLPSGVRVLSSVSGKAEPDIVTTPFNTDLDFTAAEREYIIACKADNKLDELFRMLFIKQCNALNALLPELFEKTDDYTELLLNISFTDKDGVVWHLVKDIKEDDFQEAVEIIGWMYQYYNTEPKDETFTLLKKNVKITKERIPAATQLFTPDWIVRYMVENSLGRLWLEGHPNDALKANWKYYLDEAEQTPEVQAQLEQIRVERRGRAPEDITFIDPCMGSGHILVYAFDVFMQIYESAGYSQRDAARLILEKNIYGLDIDRRAYQLAYFALMMKARQYNRRILEAGVQINLCEIRESNEIGQFNNYHVDDFLLDKTRGTTHQETLSYILSAFIDAKEYGSIMQLEQRDYEGLAYAWKYTSSQTAGNFNLTLWYAAVQGTIPPLIRQAILLSKKYDVVCTNPPYMGSSNMNGKLAKFMKDNYPDSKSDLFAAFIERGISLASPYGYNCMVTMQSWMFLSSFEVMRKKILTTTTIKNLMHMENMVMGIAFGTAVANLHGTFIDGYKGRYNHIEMSMIENDKPKKFPPVSKRNTTTSADNFAKIPGSPVAYWVSDTLLRAFEVGKTLGSIAFPKTGMTTGDNDRFLRLWHEVAVIKFNEKWFSYCKGGGYRRWYGYNEYLVNWENDGFEIKNNIKDNGHRAASVRSEQLYFKPFITWSAVTSGTFSCRNVDGGALFDSGGSSIFVNKNKLYLLALLNGKLAQEYLNISNATMNYQPGDIAAVPVIIDNVEQVGEITKSNISLSRADWDSFETSWDFKRHPLILGNSIAAAFEAWKNECEERFQTLKANEEELNRIFIDIYGLQDELTLEVADKDVTVARIYDRKEDIPESMKGNGYVLTRADVIKSFVSYAVGCMFGRYSLDVEGLAYAGGEWDAGKYSSFIPDRDNVIPITDEEYLPDDIVTRFASFVRVAYGADKLEENLRFIAGALGNNGNTAREVIRNYFLRDFFKDHVKIYKKRPIYWLFDSGKDDGFKALVYLHRYDQDTVGKLRVDYLHKLQRVYEGEIARMRDTIDKSDDAREVSAAHKRLEKLIKQLKEAREYDGKIADLALARIALNLDDGVKVNYEKLQTGTDGKKYEVLGKI